MKRTLTITCTLLAVALMLAGAPARGDIVSYWQFNNDALDAEGGNNGTLNGTPTYAAAKHGLGIQCTTSNYVGVADHSSLDPGAAMTVNLWVDVPDNAVSLGLFARDGYQTAQGTWHKKYMIYISSNGRIGAYRRSGGAEISTFKSGQDTTWRAEGFVMLTMTYDKSLGSDNLKLYLDGALYSGNATASGTGDIDAGELGMDIGRWSREGGSATKTVDDMALFNHAWTAGEVKGAFNVANHVDLKYDTGDAWDLFEEFATPTGGVTVNGKDWEKVTGLAADTPGTLLKDGDKFTLYLTATEGMQVPEPATMGLLALGFAGMAALRRRRRNAS